MLVIGSKEEIEEHILLITKGRKIIFNDYGKPYVLGNDIYFNKSDTKDIAVLVIDKCECGVDIEFLRKYNEKLAKKICSEEELEFLSKSNDKDYYYTLLWVLKEAYLKCIGVGLTKPMRDISFNLSEQKSFKWRGYSFFIKRYNEYIIAICKEVN